MSQYLGDISAYALAVSQGYTGTEEEYAELMASYATVGQTAVEAAQAALASKNAAQTAATTATNKASEATTAAQTATTKAAEASTSASTATSAKDTAVSASQTATTKATEATTAAATATSAATTATTANTAAQSAKTAAQTAQTGAETAAASVQESAAQIATNTEDITQLKNTLTDKADTVDMLKAFPTDTASGAVASFADGANVPVKSLIVNIDPVQEGSGDPSPDNVRPISGWSEVNVSHSGADMTNPTVINIQLGQTVYGGKLDVVSGELVIDRAMVDLGTLSWRTSSTQMLAQDLSPVAESINTSTLPNATCSIYKATKWGSVASTDNSFCVISNQVLVYDSRFTDATAFKTAVTGQTLMYLLATPITVTLTPNELSTLLGANNIWSDAGEVTAEYRADPTLFIQKKIAEAISALS